MTLDKSHVRILVVDDEPGIRDMLFLELDAQGYQVTTASNGAEAWDKIRQQNFDLVISDLKMPEMEGIGLLENIKKAYPRLEVIMATGYGTVKDAVAAIKGGAYDFILKPFHLDELNALIEKALEKRELKTLVALYEASQILFSTMDLNRLLDVIMNLLHSVLGADEGSIMLLNEEKKLTIAACHGLPVDITQQVQLEIGERIAGLVAKEKKGRLFINGLENYPECRGMQRHRNIHSSIVCPLLSQDELLGVLNLSRTNEGGNFTLSDLQSASIFASQAALAIQNAKLYSALERAYKQLESAQAQLVQSEKLASVGRLVSGVAHELNNPLTAIVGYSQLAIETRNLSEIEKQLPIIYSQAQRCGNIVKDLLLFGRAQKLKYEPVDPCLLIEDVLKGLPFELGKKDVAVKKVFPSRPIVIQSDPHLLKRVFSNILVNAYQAMEKLSRKKVIEIAVREVGERLRISFKDNGTGVAKEHIARIFDPFYTTKEVGKGTGLGLSLSYGIIKEHGGTIAVQSKEGEETIFIIELPLKAKAEDCVSVNEPSRRVHIKLRAGSRILLAEDEEFLGDLVRDILKDQNYHLDRAVDGSAALEKLKLCDYDIVLCDYHLPELNGMQVCERIKKLKPELAQRFIFITGSTQFMQTFNSFLRENNLSCLLKPFTKEELISAINAATSR